MPVLYPTTQDAIARMRRGPFTKKQAKHIANWWLRERPAKEYGHQHDAEYLGWWVYVTTAGKLVYMEKL